MAKNGHWMILDILSLTLAPWVPDGVTFRLIFENEVFVDFFDLGLLDIFGTIMGKQM